MASEIYFATKFRRKSLIGDHQIKKKKKKRKTRKNLSIFGWIMKRTNACIFRLSLFLSRRPITSSAQTP